MVRLKKYDQFINESLGIRFDSKGNPRTYSTKGISPGDVDFREIKEITPQVVDEFIEEIKRCLEINHEVLATDLSDRVKDSVNEVFVGDDAKWYFEPVDLDQSSSDFTFHYDDISLAFARLINLGYSIGYVAQKFDAKQFNFSKFFGYNGEVFTSEKDFKKISNHELDYSGPDISHYSLLASSFDIKTALSEENIRYGEEEQGRSEISVIFSKPFAFGYDAGAKMVDAEKELYYTKLGTTKDRYDSLVRNDNKTPSEESEFDEIKRKEDVAEYGEEYVLRQEKERREFNALSPEEQAIRKEKNKAKLKTMMADFFKDLDKESE